MGLKTLFFIGLVNGLITFLPELAARRSYIDYFLVKVLSVKTQYPRIHHGLQMYPVDVFQYFALLIAHLI